jgi:hypothetical protein
MSGAISRPQQVTWKDDSAADKKRLPSAKLGMLYRKIPDSSQTSSREEDSMRI